MWAPALVLGLALAASRVAGQADDPGLAPDKALSAAPVIPLPADHEHLAVTTVGRGTPVVVVTGVLGSSYAYRRVTPELVAKGFRVTIVDPLGFGASPRPAQADYSTSAQAARIAEVIQQSGPGRVILVCQALAGPICLRLAYQKPELVRGIVSINGAASDKGGMGEMRFALTFARVVLLFLGRGYALHKLKDGLIDCSGDPAWVTDDVVAQYAAPFGSDLRQVIRSLQSILGATEPEPLRPNLARIRAPVLLLYGPVTRNPKKPALSAEERAILRASLPAFEQEDVAGAGQYIEEEQPHRVVAAIERMRERTAP